jgi:branched-subunit amino acid permease
LRVTYTEKQISQVNHAGSRGFAEFATSVFIGALNLNFPPSHGWQRIQNASTKIKYFFQIPRNHKNPRD